MYSVQFLLFLIFVFTSVDAYAWSVFGRGFMNARTAYAPSCVQPIVRNGGAIGYYDYCARQTRFR